MKSLSLMICFFFRLYIGLVEGNNTWGHVEKVKVLLSRFSMEEKIFLSHLVSNYLVFPPCY